MTEPPCLPVAPKMVMSLEDILAEVRVGWGRYMSGEELLEKVGVWADGTWNGGGCRAGRRLYILDFARLNQR